MELKKFPSIEQFRNTVKAVRKYMVHKGLEEYTVEFIGNVKLHGTNAAIVLEDGQLFYQSRSRIIDINSDNAGFAWFCESNKERILDWMKENNPGQTFVMFGEWVGKGIQKGVGISEIEKSFFPFAFKVDDRWVDSDQFIDSLIDLNDLRIFNHLIRNMESVTIPFHNPESVIFDLEKITAFVEQECPIAKDFGISGVGEGVVWIPADVDLMQWTDLWFKVKGDKHSNSKTNTGAKVKVESVENLKEILDEVVTINRLEQGLQVLRESGKEIDVKYTGEYIRWVIGDIMREEREFLLSNNAKPEAVNSHIANRAREFFMKQFEV